MSSRKRSPIPAATGATRQKVDGPVNHGINSVRPRKVWTKKRRMLLALVRRRPPNRFQAVRISDQFLHTTVTAWQADRLEIARKYMQVKGWSGEPTTVARYCLIREEREAATDRLARELVAAGGAEDYDAGALFIRSGGTEAW